MPKTFTVLLSLYFLPFLLCAQRPPKKAKPLPDRPKLVIGIVVDQMRFDFCYRYGEQYVPNGFKRLLQTGYSFSNCQYSYFPTITAPGHASVFSGTTPRIHGIVGNHWFDKVRAKPIYCTQDDSVKGIGSGEQESRMSPRNMKTYSIADQIKMAFGGKSFGISVKDRGAILPAGHGADAAFWFEARSGNFISSTWYRNLNGKLPAWLERFNQMGLPARYKDSVWNLLKPAPAYTNSTEDNKPYENSILKNQKPVFPYVLAQDPGSGFEIIRKTPFGNTLTARLAKALIENENLGMDDKTDFLSLSFSCTDIIGHDYGPNSMEVQDTYLRLDRDLASFFDFLDSRVGKENYLLFLTADHGILEIPEFLQEQGLPAARFQPAAFEAGLKQFCYSTFGSESLISAMENLQIYLDEKELLRLNLNKAMVCSRIVEFAENQPDIYRAFAWSGEKPFPLVPFMEKYEKGWYRGRSGDIQLVLSPGILDSERKKGTSHGSPYSYDSHVPLLWMGWKIQPGETPELFQIEDIAPTLASILKTMEPNGSSGTPHKIPLK
jgi:predicted AlkP superfamily pyrophosphatase or phosphodiesterase